MRAYFVSRLGEDNADDASALTWARLTHAMRAGRTPSIGQIAHEVLYDEARSMAKRDIPVGLGVWPEDEQFVEGGREKKLGVFGPPSRPLTTQRDGTRAPKRTPEIEMFGPQFDAAARGLEEDDFAAFALTDLRGLTLTEAADVLDTSHMTVYRRRESARLILREEIAA